MFFKNLLEKSFTQGTRTFGANKANLSTITGAEVGIFLKAHLILQSKNINMNRTIIFLVVLFFCTSGVKPASSDPLNLKTSHPRVRVASNLNDNDIMLVLTSRTLFRGWTANGSIVSTNLGTYSYPTRLVGGCFASNEHINEHTLVRGTRWVWSGTGFPPIGSTSGGFKLFVDPAPDNPIFLTVSVLTPIRAYCILGDAGSISIFN